MIRCVFQLMVPESNVQGIFDARHDFSAVTYADLPLSPTQWISSKT